MKTKIVGITVLVLIALGSIGCSSSSRVWYVGGKAYAKNPETGKMMSWEYKVSEGGGWGYGAGSGCGYAINGRGNEEYCIGSELGYLVTDILNSVVN